MGTVHRKLFHCPVHGETYHLCLRTFSVVLFFTRHYIYPYFLFNSQVRHAITEKTVAFSIQDIYKCNSVLSEGQYKWFRI